MDDEMPEPAGRELPIPREISGESVSESWIRSTDLFRGRQEVRIQHNGETYRLRITKNGKLILHK